MTAALLALSLVLSAESAAKAAGGHDSTGGALTEPAVTSARYACRMGEGFAPIVRDVEARMYVTRVVAGERVTYEVYEIQRSQRGTVLLATCDRVVTTP
ncbi:MAG: hypothetical protein JNM17_19140 [Archangium sp.]|nr:hypothetical protein [Archangium sp.]